MPKIETGASVITLTDATITDATGEPIVITKGTAGTIESFSYPGGNAVVTFPGVRTALHYKPEELTAI